MTTVREIEGYWVEVSCSTGTFLFSRVDAGLVQLRCLDESDGLPVPEDVEFALEDHGYAICGESAVHLPP